MFAQSNVIELQSDCAVCASGGGYPCLSYQIITGARDFKVRANYDYNTHIYM